MRTRIASLIILAFSAMAYSQTMQTATATVGVAFSNQIAPASATGYLVEFATGSAPVVQNAVPAGLSYSNATGILSGTPTTAGTYTVTVLQDTVTQGVFNTSVLTLTVNAASPTPPVTTCSATTPCINLTWNAPTGTTSANAPTGYNVYRATEIGTTAGPFAVLNSALVIGTTYLDATPAPGEAYEYYVEAINSVGSSAPSNTFSAAIPPVVPPPSAPPPPTNFTGTVDTGTAATVIPCAANCTGIAYQWNYSNASTGWASCGPKFQSGCFKGFQLTINANGTTWTFGTGKLTQGALAYNFVPGKELKNGAYAATLVAVGIGTTGAVVQSTPATLVTSYHGKQI